MGSAYDFFKGITKSIPVLVRKMGTVVLFLGFLGLLTGYYIGAAGLSPLFLVLPVLVMLVMWNDLDQGIVALILYWILLLGFPQILG